jgi:hypothetical protein
MAGLIEDAARLSGVPIAADLPSGILVSVGPSYVPFALAPVLRACSRSDPSAPVRVSEQMSEAAAEATISFSVEAPEGAAAKVLFTGDVWTAAASDGRLEVVVAKRVFRAHGHRVGETAEGRTRRVSIRVPRE